MAGEILDDTGVKLLFGAIIAQAVNDYMRLKKAGRIKEGRSLGREQYKHSGAVGNVSSLCNFFWDGWMEEMLNQAGMKIQVSPIYKKLEPELWQNLILKRRKG